MTIRVLICDDRSLIRDAMARALAATADIEVVTTAGTFDHAVHSTDTERPDVVLIDGFAGHGDRLRLMQWLHANRPECACIVLTSRTDDDLLVAAYSASVAAVITESCDCIVLAERIRDVAAGLRFISAEDARAARRRLDVGDRARLDHLERLDAIDRQIACLIAAGHRDRAIATAVHLSAHTVRNRVSRLLRALHLTSRVELAVLIARAGWDLETDRGLEA